VGHGLHIDVNDLSIGRTVYAGDNRAAAVHFVTGRADGDGEVFAAFGGRVGHQCLVFGGGQVINARGRVRGGNIRDVIIRRIGENDSQGAVNGHQHRAAGGQGDAVRTRTADRQRDLAKPFGMVVIARTRTGVGDDRRGQAQRHRIVFGGVDGLV